MTKKRLWQTFRLWTMLSSKKRVEYLRKNGIFGHIGDDVTIMDRKVPLYAKLIRIHNNVRIASNVSFVTHDVTHLMLNKNAGGGTNIHQETVGCIEIMDNVFIGTNVTILNNVRIGPGAIVAAGAVVTKDVLPNSVVGGVPAKSICSLDEYLERRQNAYPMELRPRKQEVSDSLVEHLWTSFEDDRVEKNAE